MEAGAALRDALPRVAGDLKVGVINSLGERREREAVGLLVPLAQDSNVQVAASAAVALGKIGGAEAADALKAAGPKAPATVQAAIADGLLLCADRFLAAGDSKSAAAIYKETYDSQAPEHVRTAGYRGLVLSSGDGSVALVAAALAGNDRASLRAALQLVADIRGEAATREFSALLAKVRPAVQVALVEALKQRGDPAAAPAIVAAVESPAPEVRLAALGALGTLGDAAAAPILAETAAKATGAEQDAAREALVLIRDPKVREVLLERLTKAPPGVQAEMVRALGYRKETLAVPALLAMAEGPDEPARPIALKSLAMLADPSSAPDLIRLLLVARTDADREAAEQALAAACSRGDRPEASVPAVLGAMKGAAAASRAALLRVAGRLGGAEALSALRAGLQDKQAAIRAAALRTMAESGGPEAAPDLLALASEAPGVADRVLALRGYWRLVGLAGDRPVQQRWKMCEAGMAAAKRPDEKKLGLTELAKIPTPDALRLAETLAADEAIRGEAEAAMVQIAAAMGGSQPAEAKAALRKFLSGSKNEALRAEAAKALDAMDQYVGYLTAWLVAGPYRQQGKECQQLFDIAFAPEEAGAKDVAWKPAPPPARPALAWQVDLSGVVGGDHAVVYLKTRIWSPRAERVRLEMGADDGIKVWVNGKVVHANNAIRGLTPGQDKAEAVLKEGSNDFLVKITQHTLGCGMCMRIRKADGTILDGLEVDAGGAK
jgi:HEAT repeat protein